MRSPFAPALLALLAVGCGVPDARPEAVAGARSPIIDGRPATRAETHATVLLAVYGEVGCTGTLIAPRLVLTAAHCLVWDVMPSGEPVTLEPSEVQVGADMLRLRPERLSEVERVVVHPDFALDRLFDPDDDAEGLEGESWHDVAFLALSEPVEGVEPVRVLRPRHVEEALGPGAELEISGFGVTAVTEELLWGEEEWPEARLHVGTTVHRDHDEHDLLLGGDDVADACYGDSGGPAYVTVDGTRYVVGVASRLDIGEETMTDPCGHGSIYGIASRYLRWIRTEAPGLYDEVAPAVEEPEVEEPAVEEPAVEEPAVEEPAVEEPRTGSPPSHHRFGWCAVQPGRTAAPPLALALVAMLALGRRRRVR